MAYLCVCDISLDLNRYMHLSRSGTGVGVTKAPFVNFSVGIIFDLAKVHTKKKKLDYLHHIHI